ncbi:uncharacterized protein N7443_004674 [Penicillium atrosanguineum]|uniref:uncharacterized protein n=1 Tax=Penicillium atrosanguineum TaxID=1132637 RepID=UPI0023A6E827|nr:uncharacterized protein N7443_004674 [Penicillium atrosanguineum]KAJ5305014.1 hypothetical protein N7443_004674 [Penicillium atrosanguineum]
MRFLFAVPTLSTLVLLLHFLQLAIATPLALDQAALELEQNALEKRCSNPCGYNDWLCCGASEACSTNAAGQAECSSGTATDSSWKYYTTTYVVTETDQTTITSVWSSQIATSTSSSTCRSDLGEEVCGTICCDAAQECVDGECVAASSSAAATGAEATGTASPGVRETSSGASTVTATAAATTTQGFIAPVGTNGADLIGAKATSNNGGLSGGAIAGIVIGTIAGIILLLLLCGCLCFKGALDALLAAMGIKKRRRRETVVEERYSHHSHASRPRPAGRTWFGARPAAAAGTESSVSEKKSKWSGWGTVAIVLGALALCLGLKRRRDREHEDDDKTSYTYPSSYYYYSDYTRTTVLADEREIHGGLDARDAHEHVQAVDNEHD